MYVLLAWYTSSPLLVVDEIHEMSGRRTRFPYLCSQAARRGGADPPVTDDVSLRTCQLSDYREMRPYLRHKLTSRARDSLHSFISGINNKGSLMNCPLAAYFLLSNYSNQIKYCWLSCITEICRARRVPRRMA